MSRPGVSDIARLVRTPLEFAPPRTDKPSWDRPVCPEELLPVLFPDTPEGQNLFLLVDAPRRTAAKGVFDLDVVAQEVTARAIFLQRDDDDRIIETAPWLVDLTQARSDRAAGRVLQEHLDSHWTAETGLLVVTRAGFDDVFDHLRRLTRLRCDWQKGWLYFRFWDPSVAVPYFTEVAGREDRIGRMLMIDDAPLTLIAPDGPGKAVVLTPPDAPPPPPAPGPIVLDAGDRAALTVVTYVGLERGLARWLGETRQDIFAGLPPERMTAMAQHAVAVGKDLAFADKDEFTYLAHMMATLGGFFHLSGIPEASIEILNRRTRRRDLEIRRVFLADFLSTPRGALSVIGAEARADLAHLPGLPNPSFDDMKAFIKRHFADRSDTTGRFMQAVWRSMGEDRVPEADQGAVGLQSLFFGLRFYDDPFHPHRDPALKGPERITDALARGWAALDIDTATRPQENAAWR